MLFTLSSGVVDLAYICAGNLNHSRSPRTVSAGLEPRSSSSARVSLEIRKVRGERRSLEEESRCNESRVIACCRPC